MKIEPPKPKPVPLFVPRAKVAALQPSSKAERAAKTAKESLAAKVAKSAQPGKAKSAASEASESVNTTASTFDEAALGAGWDDGPSAARAAAAGAEALVLAWLAKSNVIAITATAESESVPSNVRKAARRAQNILKARGIAVPSRPRVARFNDATVSAFEALEATLIPPDGQGTVAIAITARDGSGRYRLAEVIGRDGVGILHAGGAWLSGSQVKEGRNRAFENLGITPTPIPLEWARHRIAALRAQNTVTKHIVPLGLEGCKDLIGTAPISEPPHPMADLEAQLTNEEASALASESSLLHEEPEFRSWLPERQALDEIVRNVGQRLGEGVSADSDRVKPALKDEISLACDRYFTPELRTSIADRMRDAAVSIRVRKGEARAREVLAVARCVREPELVTQPSQLSFLVGYFEKAFDRLS